MTVFGLAELIGAVGQGRNDQLLALLHYAEVHGEDWLTPPRIGRLFEEARVSQPNVHRLLLKLKSQAFVLQRDGEFRLSRSGFIEAESILKASGLLSLAGESSAIEPLRRISLKLRNDATGIANGEARSFVEEALRCLDPAVAALRAAVVLAWAGGIARLRDRVLKSGIPDVGRHIARLGWRVKVEKPDNLDDLRDAQLLIVAQEIGLFDKSALKALQADLDFRNACAHPTDVSAGLHRVEAFLENVIALLYV